MAAYIHFCQGDPIHALVARRSHGRAWGTRFLRKKVLLPELGILPLILYSGCSTRNLDGCPGKGWRKVHAMIPCSILLSMRRAALQGVSEWLRPRIARADDEIQEAEKSVLNGCSVLRGIPQFLGGSPALVVPRPRDDSRAGC